MVRPLADVTLSETEDASIECEVSCAGIQGKWFKNSQVLEDSSRYQYHNQDGCHRLSISNTLKEDSGVYTFKLGSVSTSARISVNRK